MNERAVPLRRAAAAVMALALIGCGDDLEAKFAACKPADRECLYREASALYVAYAKDEKINAGIGDWLIVANALAHGAEGARSAARKLASDIPGFSYGLGIGGAIVGLQRAGRNDFVLAIFDTESKAAGIEGRGVRVAACARLAAHFALSGDNASAGRFADCALETAGKIDPRERFYDNTFVAVGWGRGLAGIEAIYHAHFQRTGTRGDARYSALLATLQTWKSTELGEALVFHAGDPDILTRAVAEGGRPYDVLRRTRDYGYYAAIAPFVADLARLRRGTRPGIEVLARPAPVPGAKTILAVLAAGMAADFARAGDKASARKAIDVFHANAGGLLGENLAFGHHRDVAIGDYVAARLKLGDDRREILKVVLGANGELLPENAYGIIRVGDAMLVRLASERVLQRFAAVVAASDTNHFLAFRLAAMAAILGAALPQ